VCIAFSRNAGPHSLVACYSDFKDRAPSPDAEQSSESSLDCLADVTKTTGLLQGGRRIYIHRPGSSRGHLQPLLPVGAAPDCERSMFRSTSPTRQAYLRAELGELLARGATSNPSSSLPSSTLATFLHRLDASRGAASTPRRVIPSRTSAIFLRRLRYLRRVLLLPLRGMLRQPPRSLLPLLRCVAEGASSRPSQLSRQGGIRRTARSVPGFLPCRGGAL